VSKPVETWEVDLVTAHGDLTIAVDVEPPDAEFKAELKATLGATKAGATHVKVKRARFVRYVGQVPS